MASYRLTEHAQHVILERRIRKEWLRTTLENPHRTEPDNDDPDLCHALKVISEYGNRVLRVVYNYKKSPILIVTAYFDRSMKGLL